MSHERLVGRDMGLEGWHLVSPHPLVHSPINVLITSSKHMLHPGILTTENTENTRRVSKFGIMYTVIPKPSYQRKINPQTR